MDTNENKKNIVTEEQSEVVENEIRDANTTEIGQDTQNNGSGELTTAEDHNEAEIERESIVKEEEQNDNTVVSPSLDLDDDKCLPEETNNKKQNRKWIKIVALALVAIIVLVWGLHIIGNQIVAIEASYKGGNSNEGVVLDNSNNYITVTGVKRFGGKRPLNADEWTIPEPATLKKDKTSSVTIIYKKLSTTLEVECSESAVVDFNAEYKGDTSAGTVIDDNSSFRIEAKFKNGTVNTNYADWKIVRPMTLEANSSVEVVIKVEDIYKEITIECSTRTPESISASYSGNITEGTILDENNEGIIVTAKYLDGTEGKITDFTISEPKTLVKGETSKVVIEYLGVQCELTVQADDSAYFDMTFKEMIETINNSKGFTSTISSHLNDAKVSVYSANIDIDKEKYSNTFYYFNRKSRITDNQLYYNDDAIPDISDPINVVAFKFTDHTKNTFDSKAANIAGEMGALMGRALGDWTMSFNTMLNEGESLKANGNIIITWTHGKYIYIFYATDHSLGGAYFYDYTFRIGLVENYD